MRFNLSFGDVANSGTLQLLHGLPTSSNTPEKPNLVTPQTSPIPTGNSVDHTAPSCSLGVITVNAY